MCCFSCPGCIASTWKPGWGQGPAWHCPWPFTAPHLGAVGAGHKLCVVMEVLGIYSGLGESLCRGLTCLGSVTSCHPLGSSLLGAHSALWLWHHGVGHLGLEQQEQQLWGARSQGSGSCWGSLSGVVSALASVFSRVSQYARGCARGLAVSACPAKQDCLGFQTR